MLPKIRLHDLRHTHATLALQAGVHPKVVSERLGHATVSITLDTYSHAIPAMQEEAAALIAGLVFAKPASAPVRPAAATILARRAIDRPVSAPRGCRSSPAHRRPRLSAGHGRAGGTGSPTARALPPTSGPERSHRPRPGAGAARRRVDP